MPIRKAHVKLQGELHHVIDLFRNAPKKDKSISAKEK